MDDLTPPSIPGPQDRKHPDPDAALTRVDGADLEPGDQPEGGARPNDDAPVELSVWAKRLLDGDDSSGRRTICRVLVPALGRFESSQGPRGVREAVEAVRLAVARSHEPVAGVAIAEGREVVFVLPDGVAWSAAVTTIGAEVQRLAGDPEFELPKIAVGLADIGDSADSIGDALRLSALGLADAIETGGGARAVTAEEEQRRCREDEVLEAIADSLESGDGFRLVYQPKFAVEGESLVGAEALLRHDGGTLGAISPAEFVPLAKRFGMLERLDHWVVEKAVVALAAWREEGILGVPVSLNVGPSIFFTDGFSDELAALIEKHGVDPEDVQIEVSAPDVLSRLDRAIEQIQALHAVGVTVALDDFGQQDTTIADLRRLPVDALKVHRSLILDLLDSESASTLVRSVLSLASVLGIETVAAGVEQPEQLELLREFGCDAVQGFMLSAPLESGEFAERLRAHGGSRSAA